MRSSRSILSSATKISTSSSSVKTNKTWWTGRPPMYAAMRTLQPDAETLEKSAPKSAVPMHTQDPSVVYAEKMASYKKGFDERVNTEEELARMEDRVVGVGVVGDDDNEQQQQVKVTIFWPKTTQLKRGHNKNLRGVCLHVHGGGWLFGDSRYQNASKLLQWAEDLKIAVVSVEYRMGPENRWPAARDDVTTASEWLFRNSEKEFGTNVVVGSGESAGAQLLLLAALRLKEEFSSQQQQQQNTCFFRCLNLVYGCYDMSGTPSVLADGDESGMLSGNELLWMIDWHVPTTTVKDNLKSPDLSPLYADNLDGLPPALFSVGTADPLRDDTLFMATRYGAAGCDAEVAVYAGGQHGLGHFGVQENIPLGIRARRYTQEFLDKFLGPDE